MIDIDKSLEKLGIKQTNNGSSTGLTSFGSGNKIDSYSPVNGKLIASVTETTPKSMKK